jgi:hypothetical protein
LIIPFDRPDHEAGHARRRFRVVVHDEDPEILALWAAALHADGYDVDVVPAGRIKARIAELRRISGDTRSDDLRGAIQDAIEDCELHLGKLEPESLYLLPPPTDDARR